MSRPGLKRARSEYPDLPKRVTDAQRIWPSQLPINGRHVGYMGSVDSIFNAHLSPEFKILKLLVNIEQYMKIISILSLKINFDGRLVD